MVQALLQGSTPVALTSWRSWAPCVRGLGTHPAIKLFQWQKAQLLLLLLLLVIVMEVGGDRVGRTSHGTELAQDRGARQECRDEGLRGGGCTPSPSTEPCQASPQEEPLVGTRGGEDGQGAAWLLMVPSVHPLCSAWMYPRFGQDLLAEVMPPALSRWVWADPVCGRRGQWPLLSASCPQPHSPGT